MTQHSELKQIDQEIAQLERLVEMKQEQRREIINRENLNKVPLQHECKDC